LFKLYGLNKKRTKTILSFMNKIYTLLSACLIAFSANAQKVMTTEMLLELGKVGAMGITKDGKSVIYNVKKYSVADGKATNTQYIVSYCWWRIQSD
jgi:hypothetical protein